MALDAHRRPIESPDHGPYIIHQVERRLLGGDSYRLTWEHPLIASGVYEVAVMVTAVRFVDGSTWVAVRDYVQDIFFR